MTIESQHKPDFNTIHDLAMELADKAEGLKMSDPLASKGLFLQAASLEHAVITSVDEYPTNVILGISAASLYYNGEDYTRAEFLAQNTLQKLGPKTAENEYYFQEASLILHDAQEKLQA